jgi:hypothetical protein
MRPRRRRLAPLRRRARRTAEPLGVWLVYQRRVMLGAMCVGWEDVLPAKLILRADVPHLAGRWRPAEPGDRRAVGFAGQLCSVWDGRPIEPAPRYRAGGAR